MSPEKNHIPRFWLLLILTTLLLCALSYLPERIGSWRLKPVDLLSELRSSPQSQDEELSLGLLDEETLALEGLDSLSAAHTSAPSTALDSLAQEAESARRNQAYERLRSEHAEQGDTTSVALIEDYHPTRLGLKHFYDALAAGTSKGRPTRIAVLGDSFIEGDIMTDALREYLQRQWGGRGIGWMPITSETAGFRRSIKHRFAHWQDLSLLGKRKRGIPFTGHIYQPHQGAWVCYETPTASTALGGASILYKAGAPTPVEIKLGEGDFAQMLLPASTPGAISALGVETLGQGRMECRFPEGQRDSLVLYGCVLEDAEGVVVDNLSLRGNSGVLLLSVEDDTARAFAQVRPYDLIILQYGLNVASQEQQSYLSYARQMQRLILRLRGLYPEASIMLMGVSDRSQRSASGWERMAGVSRLHSAQRQLARSLGITFWSTLEAMEHLGGMARMVELGWAAKDYTHITHRGGRKIAEQLRDALLLEKVYYDEIR